MKKSKKGNLNKAGGENQIKKKQVLKREIKEIEIIEDHVLSSIR